jgi:hypothetical protein
MLIRKYYQVELVEHPKEGAQEWLGNTKHMFSELIDTAIAERGRYADVGRTLTYRLYRDPNGTKSDTGTYFWSQYGFRGTVAEDWIEELYGPVVVKVSVVYNDVADLIVLEGDMG